MSDRIDTLPDGIKRLCGSFAYGYMLYPLEGHGHPSAFRVGADVYRWEFDRYYLEESDRCDSDCVWSEWRSFYDGEYTTSYDMHQRGLECAKKLQARDAHWKYRECMEDKVDGKELQKYITAEISLLRKNGMLPYLLSYANNERRASGSALKEEFHAGSLGYGLGLKEELDAGFISLETYITRIMHEDEAK